MEQGARSIIFFSEKDTPDTIYSVKKALREELLKIQEEKALIYKLMYKQPRTRSETRAALTRTSVELQSRLQILKQEEISKMRDIIFAELERPHWLNNITLK
jgi:hypothetical protein